MIVLARFWTAGLVDACSASRLDSISHSFALPACARKPGAISVLLRSTTAGGGGGGGGVVEHAARTAAPPINIASLLILVSPSVDCSAEETSKKPRGSYRRFL